MEIEVGKIVVGMGNLPEYRSQRIHADFGHVDAKGRKVGMCAMVSQYKPGRIVYVHFWRTRNGMKFGRAWEREVATFEAAAELAKDAFAVELYSTTGERTPVQGDTHCRNAQGESCICLCSEYEPSNHAHEPAVPLFNDSPVRCRHCGIVLSLRPSNR